MLNRIIRLVRQHREQHHFNQWSQAARKGDRERAEHHRNAYVRLRLQA